MYTTIRNIHLILASFSLPFLLMYGVSAVQMSHNSWFNLKPVVHEEQIVVPSGLADARQLAREMMQRNGAITGELTNIQTKDAAISFRLVVPGTVHEVVYDRASGIVRLKTSIAGVMGMLNRLHHAAGLWHESSALNMWGAMVAIVSTALVLVGATGLYMWFTRRPERVIGAALLGVNTIVAVVLLTLMRLAGP